MRKKQQKINNIFKALADPTRRELFHILVVASAAMSLSQLAEQVDMTRQGVTKHVKLLEAAGMVTSSELGRERFCVADLTSLREIRDWVTYYEKFWDSAI
jgi:DNA-binding transcriptional ArsR family regulator